MIDIKVPTIGESISEVTLVKWLKTDGDYVERDEVIAELESEKATFEVNAEKAGVLKTVGKEGDTLAIGDVVAQIDDKAKPVEKGSNGKPAEVKEKVQTVSSKQQATGNKQTETKTKPVKSEEEKSSKDIKATPVASAIIADKKVDTKNIQPSGFNGKIL